LIVIPSRNVKLADDKGYLNLAWWQYFNFLTPSKPLPESTITVTTSPFSYTVPDKGAVLVQGGTVSSISLKRVSSHTLGVTVGLLPVGRGDVVTVTYTGLPTMVFLPS
jgi:hypothetical protein